MVYSWLRKLNVFQNISFLKSVSLMKKSFEISQMKEKTKKPPKITKCLQILINYTHSTSINFNSYSENDYKINNKNRILITVYNSQR